MDAPRRRRLRVFGLALVAALVVTGLLVARHRLGPKHLLTVTPDVLYRSGQLTPAQLDDVVAGHGIRTIVNLRSEPERERGDWYAEEVAAAEKLGVRLVDLPMNAGFPPRDEVLFGWLDVIGDPAAHPILVHCEHGVIRTGIMVGVYEVEQLAVEPSLVLPRFERFGHEIPEPIRSRIAAWFDGYVPRRPSS